MAEINCTVTHLHLPNSEGKMVPGLRVACSKCGKSAEVFGQRGRSLRRCLRALEEICGEKENKYVIKNEDKT